MKKIEERIRPTSGKVIGALLNVLSSAGLLDGARFLDLFAGTGSVSAAAAARGASSVVAIESDRRAASAVAKRFEPLGSKASVIAADVRRALPKLAGSRFDVVFADPPYCLGWGAELPPLVVGVGELIAPGGAFVFERSRREDAAEIAIPRDDRRYGETILSFYWM